MGVIIFNGISSKDYSIQVEHPPGYETPEREYDIIKIPGRNGDLVIDTGSYKNVNRPYDISVGSIGGDFTSLANGVSRWLRSAKGYARLEDSYNPDHYRLAFYSGGENIENILQQAGRAQIVFNCKPQRFLKTGDTAITVIGSETLINPTPYPSLPIITVKGSGDGVLNVGDYTVNIRNIINSITINSDIEDAYNGTTNLNMYITLSNGFPKLVPGDNIISFSGGITEVYVTPKWWTI